MAQAANQPETTASAWRPRWSLWRSARPHLAALALYAALALLLTWPLAASLTDAVVGAVGGVDAYQGAWGLWWTARAISAGQSPFVSPLLYYPQGVDLFWQTLGAAQGVAALPVTLALGPQAAVNATVLASYVLGGYAAFLLARRATGSAPAALVAGAVFACSPYHLEKVLDGNLEVAAIHWLALYALALHTLLERRRWPWALLAGALLVWVSLGSWYYGLFALMYTGLVAAIWATSKANGAARNAQPGAAAGARPDAQRQRLSFSVYRLSFDGVTFLWGLTPLIVWALALAPRLAGLAGGEQALMDMRPVLAERSADLLDFVLPNPRHPLWGAAVVAARERAYPDAVIWNVALGWVGIALALLGARGWRREACEPGHAHAISAGTAPQASSPKPQASPVWRWWLLLAACLVLAMGPSLKLAGWQTGLPLPFALVQNLPGVRSGQRPNHMAVLGTLALAVLAARGARRLTARLAPRAAWGAAIGLCALAALVDGYAGPLTPVRRAVHPFYASLPAPNGALLALPMLLNINRSDNLTPQTVHGWPIFGGYVARPPRYDAPRYIPGVRELEQGRPGEADIVAPGWPESGRRALAAYRVRYVTLDLIAERDAGRFGLGKAAYFQAVRGVLGELGAGAPLAADADLEAYAVPRAWPAAPLAYLGAGWQPVEQQPEADLRWRWMGEQAEIRLYNPLDHPVAARLTIRAAAYAHERELRLRLGGQDLGALRVAPDAPQGQTISVLLPPGEHVLALAAAADADPGRAEPISVRLFLIELLSGA